MQDLPWFVLPESEDTAPLISWYIITNTNVYYEVMDFGAEEARRSFLERYPMFDALSITTVTDELPVGLSEGPDPTALVE